MEFAAITETLLIDADGVYDPGDVNDRMLLGMKSTIGEVELHVMAQRLQASKKAAAARGELRTPLPVGYVHDEAGEVVIDPDAEVQAAIGDLFAAFAACGSAYGVVAAFAGPAVPAARLRRRLGRAAALGRAHPRPRAGRAENPCYAGAYVHGRYTSRRTRRPGRHRAHRARRAAPRRMAGADQRSPRRLHRLGRLPGQRGQAGGQPHQHRRPATAGGLRAVSGHHRLRVLRQADAHQLPQRPAAGLRVLAPRRPAHHRHLPIHRRSHRGRPRSPSGCWPRSTPTEVALALAAADEVTDRRQRASRAAELAVERARYEADRAERAFRAVEPENRLVARTLETRWETKLAALAEAEQALAAARDALPPLPTRAELQNTGRRPARDSGGRPPPATRTANGCCAP